MAFLLNNLLSNAIKFTDEGTIDVSVKEEVSGRNRYIAICIEDSGIGIEPEQIDAVFEPFNRIQHETQKSIDSHGLGLSIVKCLVEQHNGIVTVASKKGIGSSFTVMLPLLPPK